MSATKYFWPVTQNKEVIAFKVHSGLQQATRLASCFPPISRPNPLLVLSVYLNGKSCLHWRCNCNYHIKPGWAFLSKLSLWSAGWHGHCKYSWNHPPNGAKGAALCDVSLSLYILHFTHYADCKETSDECRKLCFLFHTQWNLGSLGCKWSN